MTLVISQGSTIATAQGPDKEAPTTKKPAWPTLDKKAKAKGEKYLKLLRSKKPEIRENAVGQLTALGAGFSDRAIRSLKDSENHNVNEHLVKILDATLKPEHSPLVALHHRHKAVSGRRYVFKTLARLGQPGSVALFQRSLKDSDIEVSYYSALGLIKATRSTAALGVVYDRCLREWEDLSAELSRHLATHRSDKFLPWIARKLKSEDTHDHVTALRMMRILSPPAGKVMVRRFLDSEHALVKKEAINTLRVIVDGEPALPLKKITVFMVINLAKAWKSRL